MQFEELGARALDDASAAGAAYADIRFEDARSERIEVRNGVCVDEDGTLAGSSLDMASAVRNAVQLLGISMLEAVQMASANPAAFLGVSADYGQIAAGCRANLVRADDQLQVIDTWIDGRSNRY